MIQTQSSMTRLHNSHLACHSISFIPILKETGEFISPNIQENPKTRRRARLQRPSVIRIKVPGYLPENLGELEMLSDAASRFPDLETRVVPPREKESLFLFPFQHLLPFSFLNSLLRECCFLLSVSPLRRPGLQAETVDIPRLLSRSLAGERAGILKFSVSARF